MLDGSIEHLCLLCIQLGEFFPVAHTVFMVQLSVDLVIGQVKTRFVDLGVLVR